MADTSTRFGISEPSADRSDAADVPLYIRNIVTQLEAKGTLYGQGLLSARPTSSGGSPGIQGRFYYATDTELVYYDYGTGWQAVGSSPSQLVPVGSVLDWPWGSGDIPAWTLLPYGQLLTQAAYPAMQVLADNAGRPYGGVAATNFNMPDYRGRVGAGKDDMGGSAASRITVGVSGFDGATLGAAGGAEGITLTTAQLPAHNHGITGAPGWSDPTHGHHSRIDNNGGSGSIATAQKTTNAAERYTDNLTDGQNVGISVTAGSLGTANNGSGSAHQNVQPTIIVNKIMRVI